MFCLIKYELMSDINVSVIFRLFIFIRCYSARVSNHLIFSLDWVYRWNLDIVIFPIEGYLKLRLQSI